MDLLVQIINNRKPHIYIYIYIYIYITNALTCFGASAPPSGNLGIVWNIYKILKLLELHKAVGRCMVNSVLLIKCGSGCTCILKVCIELI